MTTTDITTTEEAQVPSLGLREEAGLHGDFDTGDVALPICAITQPTSASERGDPGKFWFNDGRSVDQMDTVVLDIIGTRTLWAPRGKGTVEGIICRSTNRREAVARYPDLVLAADPDKVKAPDLDQSYMVCSECPHSNDEQYASADYLCKKGYTLVMVDLETGDAFLYFVKGAAMKGVIHRIVGPVLGRVQRGEPAAPWTTLYQWTTREKENAKGKFYVPDILRKGTVAPEDAARYAEQSARMGSRAQEQMEAEDLEEPEDHLGIGS